MCNKFDISFLSLKKELDNSSKNLPANKKPTTHKILLSEDDILNAITKLAATDPEAFMTFCALCTMEFAPVHSENVDRLKQCGLLTKHGTCTTRAKSLMLSILDMDQDLRATY